MNYKRIIFTLLIAILVIAVNVPASAGTYIEYTKPAIKLNIETSYTKVKYPLGEDKNTVFCNGRLCVPIEKGAELMGAELSTVGGMYRIKLNNKTTFYNCSIESNRPVTFKYNGTAYISLYELITPFNYEPVVNLSNNTVDILSDCPDILTNSNKSAQNGKAYIRLEDITADGLKPNGKYTISMLEKLKYTAEYLYMGGNEYYIAWIPLYVCPAENYSNDVSSQYNLYNAYFLYVMDYMTDHSGHLGLHGYTHQYGNDASGDGYEWGSNTPFDTGEQQRRMIAAKQLCHKLGYNEEFFEFPHYGATASQLLMAEYYFDAVYQSYPTDKLTNTLTYTTRSGKKVYYIPTPADYVHFKRDDSIFERLSTSFSKGYTISLFYHPVIDEDKIEIKTLDDKRVWSYSGDGSLPKIVKYINDRGYSFTQWS